MTTLSTSEVLNKAADLIEEHGWGQGVGTWVSDGEGLCLEGGIIAAMGVGVMDAPGEPIDRIEWEACPAYRAVHSYLNLSEEERLWEWNDASWNFSGDTRTAEDVIATLRATALIEAARERESVEV